MSSCYNTIDLWAKVLPDGSQRSGVCAVSSATVSYESFHERFSTGTRERESSREDRSSSKGEEVRESFYGRFSTSTEGREGASGMEWGPWALFMMLVVAVDLVFGFVRPFVVEPMNVPSASMAPTLEPGDRVLTNKLVYDFADPDRGDLVVFESVDERKDEEIVKRVVGLPGEEISVQEGVLLVNGEPPHEPYLLTTQESPTTQKTPGVDSFGPMVVPQNHVFVMGDNRTNSYDSRFFGPIPEENLVGEVSLRFWPPGRLGAS
jgi:signal peptidase I